MTQEKLEEMYSDAKDQVTCEKVGQVLCLLDGLKYTSAYEILDLARQRLDLVSEVKWSCTETSSDRI